MSGPDSWEAAIEQLRGRETVMAALRSAELLELLRPCWGSRVAVSTSMHRVVFGPPDARYPFEPSVMASFRGSEWEIMMQVSIEHGTQIVAAERCAADEGLRVVEGFLPALLDGGAPPPALALRSPLERWFVETGGFHIELAAHAAKEDELMLAFVVLFEASPPLGTGAERVRHCRRSALARWTRAVHIRCANYLREARARSPPESVPMAPLDTAARSFPRPWVDTLKGSRHPNMKELRPRGGQLRILFAFDPRRAAILLIGGDKTDQWFAWCEVAVPEADRLYDDYLRELRKERPGRTSPKTRKLSELAAPLHADPERHARIEQGKREILTAIRRAELRTEAGLTQTQLAERMGATQENVSRIERAEETQLSTIRRYVEALGGSLELHAVFADRDIHIAAA